MSLSGQSRRAARMQRHHRRFGRPALMLTSMMDIFTILVFFLLVNSGNETQPALLPGISLPQSIATRDPRDVLVVSVNNEGVWLQGKLLARIEKGATEPLLPALSAALAEQRRDPASSAATGASATSSTTTGSATTGSATTSPAATASRGAPVIVMADKALAYTELRRVLNTLSHAGYTDVSLAVERRDAAESSAEAGS